jgi:hypothetical protein
MFATRIGAKLQARGAALRACCARQFPAAVNEGSSFAFQFMVC